MVKAEEHKIQEGSKVATVIFYIITGLICFITLFPMYYVFIMSISEPAEVIAGNILFYPKGFTLESYKLLFQDSRMWISYGNTIIYVACGTILTLITCVLGAYPLSVQGLFAKKWVIRFLLVPMYFSGGMVPIFLVMNKLGLYNNRLAIILPGAVSIMYIILVRTYFASLPLSLRESACIDGANNFQILWKIYVPLAKPVLAVISIYTLVNIWNSWFNAMIYLPNESLHPLQMYLQRVLVQQTVDLTKLNFNEIGEAIDQMFSSMQLKYAMIIFTSLPIIFTYPFFQKYFIKGVMLGSLKE